MYTLWIEHQIRDFDSWKTAFDRDPAGRQRLGVRCCRIFRPVDDPNYVMIGLDFDGPSEAEDFFAALPRNVWQTRQAAPALLGSPQTRIVEMVKSEDY